MRQSVGQAPFFDSVQHVQTGSNVRNQLELLPSQQAHTEPVTPDLIARIRRLPTFLAAFNYGLKIATLEDKTVCDAMDLDQSHFNKITKGKASPPADERFMRYFDITGMEIPLIWLCEARGYDFLTMRRHLSETEQQNTALRQENADLRRALQLVVTAQRGGT